MRRHERFDANQEILGQGLSNFVGGFFQAYAGSGSFTRSGVNEESGARTPFAAIFSSVFLALLLLLVAPYVALIPTPAMAALILFVAYKLINQREIRHIIDSSYSETVILGITFAAGLLIELDFAIYLGVIASLLVFLNRTAHPSNARKSASFALMARFILALLSRWKRTCAALKRPIPSFCKSCWCSRAWAMLIWPGPI